MIEIVQEPDFRSLTLPDILRDELGVDTTTASDDRLERLIAQASARIARWCGRDHFGKERLRQTEWLGSERGWRIPALSRYPALVLERDVSPVIVSIAEGGATLTTADWRLGTGGMLHRVAGVDSTAWSGSPVVVDYWAGYALAEDCPPDLERACLELCRITWGGASSSAAAAASGLRRIKIMDLVEKEYFQQSSGSNSSQQGGTGGSAMPAYIAEMLQPFRRLAYA